MIYRTAPLSMTFIIIIIFFIKNWQNAVENNTSSHK